MNANSFDFYEVVRLKPTAKAFCKVGDAEGVILGMSCGEATGQWGYAVMFEDEPHVYYVMEKDLESTGNFRLREEFYDGSSIRVEVDPATGEGRIVEPEEEHEDDDQWWRRGDDR